jgi:hypothetical protein
MEVTNGGDGKTSVKMVKSHVVSSKYASRTPRVKLDFSQIAEETGYAESLRQHEEI